MGGTHVFPQHPYSSSSSLGEVSRSNSEPTSCSSSDTFDDTTSSLSTLTLSRNSSPSFEGCRDGGPLCKLSELMTHLPIKRGLSMHYSGKSQSFTSLASARSLKDLAKKENPHAKRLKLCVGRSSPEGWGRRSLLYGPNVEAKAAATSKRPVGIFDQQQEASNSYSQDILSTIF